jgi:hypothetical protein
VLCIELRNFYNSLTKTTLANSLYCYPKTSYHLKLVGILQVSHPLLSRQNQSSLVRRTKHAQPAPLTKKLAGECKRVVVAHDGPRVYVDEEALAARISIRPKELTDRATYIGIYFRQALDVEEE